MRELLVFCVSQFLILRFLKVSTTITENIAAINSIKIDNDINSGMVGVAVGLGVALGDNAGLVVGEGAGIDETL